MLYNCDVALFVDLPGDGRMFPTHFSLEMENRKIKDKQEEKQF